MEERRINQTTLQAQLSALIMVPFIVGAWVIAVSLYGIEFLNGRDNIWTIVSCIAMLGTMIPHELIHALGWMISAGKKRNEMKISIKLPFGASIRFYGDMKVSHFIFGLLLPFIITSLIPVCVGIIIGNFYVLLYGSMLALTCGSDILQYFLCCKYYNKTCYDPGVTGIIVKGVEI